MVYLDSGRSYYVSKKLEGESIKEYTFINCYVLSPYVHETNDQYKNEKPIVPLIVKDKGCINNYINLKAKLWTHVFFELLPVRTFWKHFSSQFSYTLIHWCVSIFWICEPLLSSISFRSGLPRFVSSMRDSQSFSSVAVSWCTASSSSSEISLILSKKVDQNYWSSSH